MTRAVISHGAFGSPSSDWIPWLKEELVHRGVEVITPCYPTPAGQELSEWFKVFRESVPPMDASTILIGHSIGATFTLRVLEQCCSPVRAAFLVAGSITHLNRPEIRPLMASFVEPPFHWEIIGRRAGVLRVFHSTDDPIVPFEKGLQLAGALGVPLIQLEDAGHFIRESGFGTFPLLLEQVIACF